jgi:class 3 adenylate cyclase/tetratricopeptide (TPR) repeat protein
MVGQSEALCAACGAANLPGSRFCSSCGARLGASEARAERKLVSILFVDLVGFTAGADRADPEDVRESQQLYHAEAKRHIEEYGGVVEKFIGDAVMAVFGAPTAHGDDAERAVRAGLRVLGSLDALNIEHGLALAARAAVNTGEAVVMLGAAQGEPLATGDVVNTAARLQAAAPEGRLIVGAETHRASRHGISYEQAAPVHAKGKSEPLETWIALGPVAETELRAGRGPLVGRSNELTLLEAIWGTARSAKRPHLVTVLGPPGIGKSRVCQEFSEHVSARGGRILRGRCLPYEVQVGYQAFSRLVRSASGIHQNDAPATAQEKLRRALERRLAPAEVDESYRYLALLLGLAPDVDVPGMHLLFFAARRFVETVGLEQPTVFVFEDIHWARESEVSLLGYLAQHLRDSPVLLVATARPELLDRHPTWGAGLTAHTTVFLEPLAKDDAETLAARLVHAAGAERVAAAKIADAAGGNPLFIEELAAALTEAEAGTRLPVTVREAIAARIDALPSEARSVLLAASVVGRTFWREVVAAVCDAADIDGALVLLELRDVVRRDVESQFAGDVQLTFKHVLVHEAAYAIVPRAVRRERHAAVAAALEEKMGQGTATLPTLLARHWREAGEPARAIPYLLAAADAARRSWAQDTLVDLYSLAVDLADTPQLRRTLRLQRGLALAHVADYPRAAEELAELLPELEGQEKLNAMIGLAHAYLWTERDEDTLATAQAAAAFAEEVDDPTAGPAILAMESQALAMRGKQGDLERAFDLGERALMTWVPGARPADLTEHLQNHADTAYWIGQYERALDLSRRTRRQAADIYRAESLLRGGGYEALTLAALGRHEEAIAIWDELFQIAGELGRPRTVLLNYSSLAFREVYDIAEARRRTEEAVELAAGLTFSMPRQFAGSDLLFTNLLAGDIGAAQAAWPGRWDGAAEATAWTTWLIRGRLAAARAEIALHAEPAESALEWAERSLNLARRTSRRKYEARSLTLLGHALKRLGKRDEALAALREATVVADSLIGPPGRWQAWGALGEAAYTLGDDGTAATAYTEAHALLVSFADSLSPVRRATLLAAPQVAHILSAGRTTGG